MMTVSLESYALANCATKSLELPRLTKIYPEDNVGNTESFAKHST